MSLCTYTEIPYYGNVWNVLTYFIISIYQHTLKIKYLSII